MTLPVVANASLGHVSHHNDLHTRYNNSVEVRSGTAATRPAANAVPAGTIYWATDTEVLSRSDGATWDTLTAGVSAHNALSGLGADDHTQYRLESADHSHLSTGLQGGVTPGADTDAIHDNVGGEINAVAAKATPVGADMVLIEDSAASNAKKKVLLSNLGLGVDHADLVGLTTGDPHTQYVQESLVDAKGDIITATANDTVARLGVGADGTVLTAASGQATGLSWATVGGGPTFVYKTADESVISSATLQDDDHLFLTTVANGIYAFEGFLHIACTTNSGQGWKLLWVEPDGTFEMWMVSITGPDTDFQISQRYQSNVEAAGWTGSFGGTLESAISCRGIIIAGGAGGTFKLQWAQGGSVAQNTTFKTGSWISYKKLN